MEGLFQLAHVGEGAPPNAAPSDLGEEALHLIQPTGTGGGEVQVIAGMRANQRFTLGVLWVP